MSSWLFSLFCKLLVVLFFLKKKKIAAGLPVNTINVLWNVFVWSLFVRFPEFTPEQNVHRNGMFGRWNAGLLALALCGHPHTLVASLSCGFFFMWVDKRMASPYQKCSRVQLLWPIFSLLVMKVCEPVPFWLLIKGRSTHDIDREYGNLSRKWKRDCVKFDLFAKKNKTWFIFCSPDNIDTLKGLHVAKRFCRALILFFCCFFFARQCQQTWLNRVISCCASALLKPCSSFFLTRMLYLSRHVYDISENTNFLRNSSDRKSSMLCSPKACLGVECCSWFAIVCCDSIHHTGLCFFVSGHLLGSYCLRLTPLCGVRRVTCRQEHIL